MNLNSTLGSIYTVASLAPIIFGGAALTVLKPFYRTEDDIKKDTDRVREVLIERICLSYDRIIPALSDAFSDMVSTETTRDDVRSILRGDGKGKPDLCYEHFRLIFITNSKLQRLDTIRKSYRRSHSFILCFAVLGVVLLSIGTIDSSLKGIIALLGFILFAAQVGIVFHMRALSSNLEDLEREA